MSYVGGRGDVLGDDYVPPGGYSNIPGYVPPPAPEGFYSDYDAMVAKAAADLAAEAAAGGYQGPGEHYRDAQGNDISVEEGRALLLATYTAEAMRTAQNTAATPGYTGGGEDFVTNQVAQQFAITQASQFPTGGAPVVELPTITDSPLYAVPAQVTVTGTTNGSTAAGGTAGGGSSSTNGAGSSASENYPVIPRAFFPSDRPATGTLRPAPGETAVAADTSTKKAWIIGAVAALAIGAAVLTSRPSRRR